MEQNSKKERFSINIFNQYSLVWGSGFLLAILAAILLRDGVKKSDIAILAGCLILLAVFWLVVRPRATPLFGAQDARSEIGAGTPVLLEFQSPY